MGANPGHGRHTQSIKGKQEKNKYKDDKSPIIESFKTGDTVLGKKDRVD